MKKNTDDSPQAVEVTVVGLLEQAAAQLTDEQDGTAEKHNALHYVQTAVATLKPNA